jgi:uncharacterized membrane protein YbaN (DUF454 family)
MHPLSAIRRSFLIIAGLASVVAGAIGIVVPLLPTTPFLLLAAVCFARSSDPLHRWLTTNRVFGVYLRNYQEHRAMPAGMKWCAISVLWLTISLSIVAVDTLSIRIVLVVVAIGVTILIARIRTLENHRDDSGVRP